MKNKQTTGKWIVKLHIFIYIYIMIFKAAINMGNDQPLNMATGNISTRRLAIRKLSEKKSSKAHPRSPHQHFKLGPTLW